eukprot:5099853-Pleurochrysis_carterae.AAC.3
MSPIEQCERAALAANCVLLENVYWQRSCFRVSAAAYVFTMNLFVCSAALESPQRSSRQHTRHDSYDAVAARQPPKKCSVLRHDTIRRGAAVAISEKARDVWFSFSVPIKLVFELVFEPNCECHKHRHHRRASADDSRQPSRAHASLSVRDDAIWRSLGARFRIPYSVNGAKGHRSMHFCATGTFRAR